MQRSPPPTFEALPADHSHSGELGPSSHEPAKRLEISGVDGQDQLPGERVAVRQEQPVPVGGIATHHDADCRCRRRHDPDLVVTGTGARGSGGPEQLDPPIFYLTCRNPESETNRLSLVELTRQNCT